MSDGKKELVLSGTVVLDESSKESLREEIRKEVIEEIKNTGNYDSEIIDFLLDCKFKSYYNMIKTTISKILDSVDEDKDVSFTSDRDILKKLKLIQGIINL